MAQRSIPFYFQSASHDCVPACVMAIADFYQVSIALHEIRSLLVTDPVKGTVIKHMQNLGEYFQVKLGRITDLSQLPQYLPFIAYLNEQHAVVVWRAVDGNNETYQIGDPAVGLITMTLQELLLIWDGITVVLRPLEEKVLATQEKQSVHRNWRYKFSFDKLNVLQLSWWMMGWESVIVALVGALNIAYSLYYVQLLPDFNKFLLFMAAYGILSLLLTIASSVISVTENLPKLTQARFLLIVRSPLLEPRYPMLESGR